MLVSTGMSTGKKKQTGKNPSRRGLVAVLTEEQKVAAHLYIKHGSKTGPPQAAEALGATPEQVKKLLDAPAVKRYIQQYNHAFLREMARYELSKITRFPVSREDVVGRLYALALTPPEETKGSIEGQVKAVETLADVLGLKFNPRDADTFFKDKTPAELENYARYGKFDVTEEEKKVLDASTEPAPKP